MFLELAHTKTKDSHVRCSIAWFMRIVSFEGVSKRKLCKWSDIITRSSGSERTPCMAATAPTAPDAEAVTEVDPMLTNSAVPTSEGATNAVSPPIRYEGPRVTPITRPEVGNPTSSSNRNRAAPLVIENVSSLQYASAFF